MSLDNVMLSRFVSVITLMCITACAGGVSLVPSSTLYAPPVPVPQILYENDKYPENFITQAQTTLKLFWSGDQSSTGPPIRAYQLEMAKIPRLPNVVDSSVADVADSISFETYATDIGLLSAEFRSVQVLTIKGDSTLSGTYQLAFAYGQELTVQPHLDPEQNTVTAEIPVGATSAQVRCPPFTLLSLSSPS